MELVSAHRATVPAAPNFASPAVTQRNAQRRLARQQEAAAKAAAEAAKDKASRQALFYRAMDNGIRRRHAHERIVQGLLGEGGDSSLSAKARERLLGGVGAATQSYLQAHSINF